MSEQDGGPYWLRIGKAGWITTAAVEECERGNYITSDKRERHAFATASDARAERDTWGKGHREVMAVVRPKQKRNKYDKLTATAKIRALRARLAAIANIVDTCEDAKDGLLEIREIASDD
jgi:hypothetical protein